jgi:hypothetical protein
MIKALFYVSSHGFGHAVRAAEVIRALGEIQKNVRVVVKTSAPGKLFAGLPAVLGDVTPVEIDTGVEEQNDTLRIDKDATVARLETFIEQSEKIVASEVEFVRREGISLIIADVPYLAGEISERADVPAMAIGNFTWDWIYEPYLAGDADGEAHLARIRRGYGSMACYLRLPFSHDTETFRRIVDVPLITREVRRDTQDVLRKLGVDLRDQRTRVVYAMRSPRSLEALARAAHEDPDRLFFYFEPPQQGMPGNMRSVVLDDQLGFLDVLGVCDAIVSKLGYGILADCLSTQTAVLFPPRFGFREDDILVPSAYKYLRACEIPLREYESGDWMAHLGRLEATPEPTESLATHGASTCARILGEQCSTE